MGHRIYLRVHGPTLYTLKSASGPFVSQLNSTVPHGKHILTTNCGALQIDFLMIPLHLQFLLPITCGIVFIKIPGVFLQSLGMFWSYSLWCGLQFKNKGSQRTFPCNK